MAIQISEKNLSPEARNALNNSKNKSQLMRDALEYYVGNKKNQETLDVSVSCDTEIKNEIKEIKDEISQIKEILMALSTNNTFKIDNISMNTAENIKKKGADKHIELVKKVSNKVSNKVKELDKNSLEDVEIPDCYI